MISITGQKLINKLQTLNDQIFVHEPDSRQVYYLGRAGLYYGEQHITNMELGDIPEYDIWDKPQTEMIPITVEEALNEKGTLEMVGEFCEYDWIYKILDNILGKSKSKIHRFDGSLSGSVLGKIKECKLERIAPVINGLPVKGIKVTNYLMPVMYNSRVAVLGWRTVLKFVEAAKIPGVNREALEELFGVNLDPELGENNNVNIRVTG